MNHVSILEADILVTKKKKKNQTVRCEMIWAELPNYAFQIINFYLSYPLLLFFVHYSLLYLIVLLFFTLDFFRYARAYGDYR